MATKDSNLFSKLGLAAPMAALSLALTPAPHAFAKPEAPAATAAHHTASVKLFDGKTAAFHMEDVAKDVAGFAMLTGKNPASVGFDKIAGLGSGPEISLSLKGSVHAVHHGYGYQHNVSTSTLRPA